MNRAVRFEVIGHIIDDHSEFLKVVTFAQHQSARMNPLTHANEIAVNLGKRSDNFVRKPNRKVTDHRHRTREHSDK